MCQFNCHSVGSRVHTQCKETTKHDCKAMIAYFVNWNLLTIVFWKIGRFQDSNRRSGENTKNWKSPSKTMRVDRPAFVVASLCLLVTWTHLRWGLHTRGGGILPSKRLLGMCRWMRSHFHNWTDYNGVTFLVELLEWGHTFSGFMG